MSTFDNASLVFIPSGYKTSKAYSVKPSDGSGDLAFSRSNDTATRVNSAGLIEKVRTNLILQSQDFSTTWSANSCSVSTNTTANPLDGAVNADTITFTGGTTQKYVIQAFSFNGNYTASVYLKAGTNQFVQLLLGSDASAYVNFDLVNGTYSAVGSVANMVSVGSGWYRCSMSFTSTIGTHVFIQAVNSLAASRFDATTSTGTLIAFGYQLETGDVATSYIATTSAAVSVGPVANVPRLDYLNSSCPRLLLEPQRTNLLTYSEQFNNAAYALNNATITANSVVSPDGYTNADTYTATGGGNYINGNATSTGSNTITYSVFAKAGTQNVFRIREANYFGSATIFNLSTGTVTSGTGTITSYGNGWYRCTHTQAYGAGQVIVSAIFDTTASSGTFYLYGAQFEVGAYATSYIPTLGAAVTRGADACSKTGISSLIGQTEGTLFVDFNWQQKDGVFFLNSISDGTTDNEIMMAFGSTDNNRLRFSIASGGSASVSFDSTALASGRYKVAFAYANNNATAYINGVQQFTDSSVTIPATSAFKFLRANDTLGFVGSINQQLLFKTRLTNAQLAELTTL